jgi:hypothetical protein
VLSVYNTDQYIDATIIPKYMSVGSESPSIAHSEMAPKVDIIDIRHNAVEMSLKDEIVKSLKPQEGPKKLPTLLLYDERGLQLFEEVSSLLPKTTTRKRHQRTKGQ